MMNTYHCLFNVGGVTSVCVIRKRGDLNLQLVRMANLIVVNPPEGCAMKDRYDLFRTDAIIEEADAIQLVARMFGVKELTV